MLIKRHDFQNIFLIYIIQMHTGISVTCRHVNFELNDLNCFRLKKNFNIIIYCTCLYVHCRFVAYIMQTIMKGEKNFTFIGCHVQESLVQELSIN